MKTQFDLSPKARPHSHKLDVARLHARLTRQLTLGNPSPSAGRFDSSLSLFNGLWSPVRLDLLKIPVTRHRE